MRGCGKPTRAGCVGARRNSIGSRDNCFLRLDHERDAAERCLGKALAIAQQQDAKFWELRAATSIARLWCDQGKQQEAQDVLAPIVAWFTEGFDTLDMKQAKALLDELASSAGVGFLEGRGDHSTAAGAGKSPDSRPSG